MGCRSSVAISTWSQRPCPRKSKNRWNKMPKAETPPHSIGSRNALLAPILRDRLHPSIISFSSHFLFVELEMYDPMTTSMGKKCFQLSDRLGIDFFFFQIFFSIGNLQQLSRLL